MKKILYFLLILTLWVGVPSCTKDNTITDQQYDRINDYAVFVSATNRTSTGVQLNIQLKNIRQIYEAHIYAKNDVYQYTLQWDDRDQFVTDNFIEPTATTKQYYFKIVLTNNEVINGKPFTVKF